MLAFIKDKYMCTGCTACLSACPQNCISMVRDEEGFLYPDASDKCTHCGLCKRVCPQQKSNNRISPEHQYSYCGVTKSVSSWRKSASGGAFGEIAFCWGDNSTVIYGAAWSDDCRSVVHRGVEYEFIDQLRKSKYIASEMQGCFREIKTQLEEGRYVVFSGTPCQVAGLKAFLRCDYEKLLLIDVICHGVGSQSVFGAAISALERQLGGKIQRFEFRSKRSTHETDYLSKVCLNSGEEYYLLKDQYIQLFLSQKCLRPSCGENCQYRTMNRQSDITIADFKQVSTVFPSLKGTKRNYSTIVFNSEKALTILTKLEKRMILYKCDIDDIIKYNPLFAKQGECNNLRDHFYKEFVEDNDHAIASNTVPAVIYPESLKRRIFDLLPVFIRKLVM